MDKKKYLELRRNFDLSFQPYYLLLHILQDALLLITTYGLIRYCAHSFWIFFGIPLIATLMFRNFSLMHDASHNTISKNKKLNDAIGIISGGLCLLPFEPWKQVHLEHHYWSGNIEKDPVMALIRTFPQWDKKVQTFLGFLWKTWIPSLALLQYSVFWWHSSVRFLKKLMSIKSILSIVFPVALLAAVILSLGRFQTLTLLLPGVLLYLLAVEVVNFPHHIGLPYIDQEAHFPLWEQHISARSCVYPKWISKFIVLNFNYHIEHHMFPDAPWYHLDKLHRAVKGILKENYNTDPQFVWIKENRIKSLAQLFRPEQRLKAVKETA